MIYKIIYVYKLCLHFSECTIYYNKRTKKFSKQFMHEIVAKIKRTFHIWLYICVLLKSITKRICNSHVSYMQFIFNINIDFSKWQKYSKIICINFKWKMFLNERRYRTDRAKTNKKLKDVRTFSSLCSWGKGYTCGNEPELSRIGYLKS